MMTFKNAVGIASLLAVVLLAVPAVAGTATYLGTHTASDAQIGDVGAPAFGSMTATYAGATIDLAGGTDGIENVFNHRPLADGMQDFRQIRLHPLALSGSQNDGDGVNHGSRGLMERKTS